MKSPEEVGRGGDVQPWAEPEAVGDMLGDASAPGGTLGLDGGGELGEVGVTGRGLGEQVRDERE